MSILSARRRRVVAGLGAGVGTAALLFAVPQVAEASGPTTVTQTFSYSTSLQSFTVPAGIRSLTLSVTGGAGGNGGSDATPAPASTGYQGVVSGTVSVTPGQVLTIGVGSGGTTGASRVSGSASNATAAGGSNPFTGYAGGAGGKPGNNGTSGAGGAGGAASVVKLGSATIVAAGGGGNGGSGQYAPTQGRVATSTFAGRADSVTTSGQGGVNASDACTATSCSNSDGGGSGGGGGGAQGGAQGAIAFGAGTSNEWFGYAGSVGSNDTASLAGLSSSYAYYTTTSTNGSVVVSYVTGPPAVPTAVLGTAGNASAALSWTAPSNPGQAAVSDYLARWSSNGGTTWSSSFDLGTASTSGAVTGLINGTGYIFQIAAVSSAGTGDWSASSATITPLSAPASPTIVSVAPSDGALVVTVAPGASSGATSPVTGYQYRLNGGSWVSVSSTATTITIPGLTNGTTYGVEVRASSAVGPGSVSSPSSGTPYAVPGAPTITALSAVGDGAVSIAFTPGFTGGSSITGYQYSVDGGAWVAASGTTSPLSISGLARGTSYGVRIRAVNGSGSGAASASSSITTPDVPAAPVITSATGGDGSVTLNFSAPSTGGSPLDHYEYQTSSGGAWTPLSGSTSPLTVTGLTNGVGVTMSLRAVNSVGAGPASNAVAALPATVPSAPSILGSTVAASNGSLTADFTAPADDGGTPVTGYQYSTDGGATWRDRADGGVTTSPLVITGLSSDGSALTGGSTYRVELRAVNAMGAGTASPVATGIARTAPAAPTITGVAARSGALQVTFAAGPNGGSPITSYSYSVDGGSTWTGTGTLGTTFLIPGLTNGTTYPVTVRATSSIGTGAASVAALGTPAGLPGGAVISSVTRSDRTLTAVVALPDSGGSAITAWQYSTDGGATWATASGTTSPLVLTAQSSDGVTRLANGTGYALVVRAVTAIGTGAASATTVVGPAAAPAAPAIALTPGNRTISIAFALGADGGSPITGLDVSLDGGTTWTDTGTLTSPLTLSGLSNGTAYAVQLRADNAIGAGSPSLIASTTPRTSPGSPTIQGAVSNTSALDVSWTAPSDTGGAAVTQYVASAFADSSATTVVSSCTTTGATGCRITGLTNGTTYWTSVTATNAAGTGAPSAPRVPAMPLTRPSAPTIGSLTSGDGSLSIAFTAGAAGDRSISGYQYSLDGGTTWTDVTGISSPILVTGLVNGTGYPVVLRAVSAAGVGAASASVSGTPVGYPSAPTTVTAVPGSGSAAVSWSASNLAGGTLGTYTATAYTAASSGSTAGSCSSTGLSCTITNLANGVTYYVSVQTVNSVSMYSPRSDPRVAVTPSQFPSAPGAVTAVAGNGTAALSWTAPVSAGGSAITSYSVSCSRNGGAYSTCASGLTGTTTTLTGLVNGSTYAFQVIANNAYGSGAASSPSNAVTPLAPGVAPLLGTAASTADGFVVPITNYSAGTTYVLSTGAGSITRTGAGVTVSGLAPGASATIGVLARLAGSADASTTLTASALVAGVTPTFAGMTSATDGFSFRIANLDTTSTYILSVSNGATVTRADDLVTVAGLSLGQSATVSVLVRKSGSTDASSAESGSAMVAGTAPTFQGLASTSDGIIVDIANYDPTLRYTVTASAGTVTRSGGHLVVTGLTAGQATVLTVTATVPNVSVASATTGGSALLGGTSPTLSPITVTADGYAFDVVNPDPSTVYTVQTTAGTATIVAGHVVVTGLQPGGTAQVTVIASRVGYTTATTAVTASALLAGVVPLFGAPVRTADGERFAIANFDTAGTYTLTATAGSPNLVGSDVLVTGLAPGQSTTVTVTVSHPGYIDAAATQTGSALASGAALVLSPVASTTDGFTFAIGNVAAGTQYSATVSSGTVVLDGSGHGTVAGLNPGASATVTVAALVPGVSFASAGVSGTALLDTARPVLSGVTPLAGGYRFSIQNLDPNLTYSFVESHGGSVVRSGAMVTVSGLGAGVLSDTIVTASAPGHVDASASATGTSFPNGAAVGIGVVTRTADGFTVDVTLDPGSTYSVTSDAGTATLVGSSVTVTGLAPGQTTTVHLTASAPGVLDSTADVAGTAISLGIVPILGAPASIDGGFTLAITNWSAQNGYALTTSAGTVTRSGAAVTVSGLGSAASATVTVTVTLAGSLDATASTSGTARTVAVAPVIGSPVPTPAGPTVVASTLPTTTSAQDIARAAAAAAARIAAQAAPAAGPGSAAASRPAAQLPTTSRPGSGAIVSGGITLPSTVTASGRSAVLSEAGGIRIRVTAQRDGRSLPLAADGSVTVTSDGRVGVDIAGFRAATAVTVAIDGVDLASGTTSSTGALDRIISIPSRVAPGSHTILVRGTGPDGQPVSAQLGLRVLDASRTSAISPGSAGGGTAWWWLALLLAAAVAGGAWWMIAARRTRRDHDERTRY